MCGIIGYIGNENAIPIIVEGLKKLEYRGYDSAGIAVCTPEGFFIAKQKGRLKALEEHLLGGSEYGSIGIGHTRWATHGEPSDTNSHPHVGNHGKIAVVHNGIIENYKQLKERLIQKGVLFHSETDSEVVAQLAEYYYDGDLVDTVIKLSNALEGSYALGIMCTDNPDTLIAIKKDNPLIVGISDQAQFLASDVPALLKHTNRVVYLADKEIAVLTRDGVRFLNTEREPVIKKPEVVTWSAGDAEKGGYEHFMLKEIMEQPKILRDTVQSGLKDGENVRVIEGLNITYFNKIVIAACGSAYNVGLVAKYVLESLCRVSVEVDIASEFRYKNPVIDQKTLVILVSQSGETADTIAALREAKRKGATTAAIVNVVGSTLAKEADACILTAAGPEIAVATTKAFSAQLAVLYLMAVRFAVQLGTVTSAESEQLFSEIAALPDKVSLLLTDAGMAAAQKYAASCIGYKSIFFIGRNIDYAIAAEGSLKLKEISYIHSEAYAGGELKHGTISLVEENTLVVVIATCERLFPKIISNAEQVLTRGAKVLLIGADGVDGGSTEKLTKIELPQVNELFSPSLSVIILQLLAYYISANKGLDIDKPRNLAKSVTVE